MRSWGSVVSRSGRPLLTEDSPWFLEASERAQREGLAHRKLLGGGHDAMISEPDKVAAVLAELAGGDRYRRNRSAISRVSFAGRAPTSRCSCTANAS